MIFPCAIDHQKSRRKTLFRKPQFFDACKRLGVCRLNIGFQTMKFHRTKRFADDERKTFGEHAAAGVTGISVKPKRGRLHVAAHHVVEIDDTDRSLIRGGHDQKTDGGLAMQSVHVISEL